MVQGVCATARIHEKHLQLAFVGPRQRGQHGHRPGNSKELVVPYLLLAGVGRWNGGLLGAGMELGFPSVLPRGWWKAHNLLPDSAPPQEQGRGVLDSRQEMRSPEPEWGRVPREPAGEAEPRQAPGTQLRMRHRPFQGLAFPPAHQ